MTGTVSDTYVAALQHNFAEIPADATLVGVVRRPTRWFYGAIDENEPALGPPRKLLTAVNECEARHIENGLAEAAAHNRAMADCDFDRRYREYLVTDTEARAGLQRLRERLEDGEDIAVVCFENTEEKRCHRTIVRSFLQE